MNSEAYKRLTIIYCALFLCVCIPSDNTNIDNGPHLFDLENEYSWLYASVESTSVNAHFELIDTANKIFSKNSSESYSAVRIEYFFTTDSVFKDYEHTGSSNTEKCSPYMLSNGDTIAGDSITCQHSILKTPSYLTLERLTGTWHLDSDSINFHYAASILNDVDPQISFFESAQYSFSNNGDTLWLYYQPEILNFVKTTVGE